jgi:hypothetical protein
MTTGQSPPQPPPGTTPAHEPAHTVTRQPLDRTKLWTTIITAASGIIVAVIGAISAIGAGWLNYTGPGSSTPQSASPMTKPAQASPTASQSPKPKLANSSAYLTTVPGQASSDSDTLQNGQWTILGTTYPHSVGYNGTDSVESISYSLKGKSYSWFDATVGVNDDADTLNQDTPITFTVMLSPGDTQATYTASWHKPQSIHLPLHGATLLTLQTDTTGGLYSLFPGSVAVWGNARLTP